MNRRCLLAILCGTMVVCAGRAPAGGDEAVKKELQKLAGTWELVSGERNGIATDRFDGSKLTVNGDSFSVEQDGKQIFKAAMKVDPGKNPKTVDLKILEGEEKGETVLGVYALEGDSLKLCFGKPGVETRPADFITKEGSENMCVVLKRVK